MSRITPLNMKESPSPLSRVQLTAAPAAAMEQRQRSELLSPRVTTGITPRIRVRPKGRGKVQLVTP